MATVHENAFMVLRMMNERGLTRAKEIGYEELEKLSELSELDFEQVDEYLLQSNFITGAGGRTGKRWITSLGIDHVRAQIDRRLPLSLAAEKILRWLADQEPPSGYPDGHGAPMNDLRSCFNLAYETLLRTLRELEDNELACSAVKHQTITDGHDVRITVKGRKAVRSEFRIETAAQVQIGAVFQGVKATNLVNNINSQISAQIEQTVIHNDIGAIQKLVEEILNNLVANVSELLSVNQQQAYAQAASDLLRELQRPQPDTTIVQRLIRILNFGDTLNGTLDLGNKAFIAGSVVAPHLPILYEYIKRLLHLG